MRRRPSGGASSASVVQSWRPQMPITPSPDPLIVERIPLLGSTLGSASVVEAKPSAARQPLIGQRSAAQPGLSPSPGPGLSSKARPVKIQPLASSGWWRTAGRREGWQNAVPRDLEFTGLRLGNRQAKPLRPPGKPSALTDPRQIRHFRLSAPDRALEPAHPQLPQPTIRRRLQSPPVAHNAIAPPPRLLGDAAARRSSSRWATP